jgi:adenylosuccinate synthase
VGDLLHPETFEAKLKQLVRWLGTRYNLEDVDVESEVKKYLGYAERLRPQIVDTVELLQRAMKVSSLIETKMR